MKTTFTRKFLSKLVIVLMIAGCDIEGALNDASQRCEYASQRCEDEIEKIIQSIESSCLTKDELFGIIDSVRAQNDNIADCVADDEGEENEKRE